MGHDIKALNTHSWKGKHKNTTNETGERKGKEKERRRKKCIYTNIQLHKKTEKNASKKMQNKYMR